MNFRAIFLAGAATALFSISGYAAEETVGTKCQKLAYQKGLQPLTQLDTKSVDYKSVTLPDGRMRVTINHPPIKGLTVAQVAWWYRNSTQQIPGNQFPAECKAYMILDTDHNAVEGLNTNALGELQKGSLMKVHEISVINNKTYEIKETLKIADIKDGHILYIKDSMFNIPMGTVLASTDRTYKLNENGELLIVSVMTAGIESKSNSFLIKKLNGLLTSILFKADKQYSWVKHASQEQYALQEFLPWLMQVWNQGLADMGNKN